MPRKFINGTITSGYTLKSNYASLTIDPRGVVDGAAGGGVALTSQYGASVYNHGKIIGGEGAYGVQYGVPGGAGVSLTGGGSFNNSGSVIGGTGGSGSMATGRGGAGGDGVRLSAGGTVSNTGLISGGAGGSGYYGWDGGAGVSLLSGGSLYNAGVIRGGAAGSGRYPGGGGPAVELLAGGTVTNSGLISGNAGVELLNGGTLENSGSVVGGVVIGDAATVVNQGTIVGAWGIYIFGGGKIENSGTIIANGPEGYYRSTGAGVYSRSGYAIDVTNLGTIISNTLPSLYTSQTLAAVEINHSTFINGAGALAQGYNGFEGRYGSVINCGVIYGVKGVGVGNYGVSVINHAGGLIEGATWGISETAATVTNFGTITGSTGAVDLGGRNGRLIAEGGSTFIGAVKGEGGALELASGTESISGIGGAGAISGGLAMTFSGFGTYQLDAGGHVTLRGTNTLGIGKTLVDDGALSVAGTLNQLGRVTVGNGEASANLTVLPSRVWNLDGALVYGGAASSERITIFGTLANTAGLSEVGVAIHDNGVISVAAGILDLSGSVWGTGSLTIGPGAMLEADSVVGGGLTVDFKGASTTLALSEPKGFAAAIQGLATGDTIDLINLKATGASVNAGDQLVIVDGATTVAALQLKGSYSGATFSVGSDGKGGTDITLTKASGNPPQAFVAAMAAMGAAPGPSSAPQSHAAAWAPALLTPRI
jgi:hypothetical protein